MAEFFKADSQWAGLFGIIKQTGEFGFGSARKDFAHDLAGYVDGAV